MPSAQKRSRVAEIKVTYKTVVKKEERYKFSCCEDVYKMIVKELYKSDTIEYVESFYILLLNRANEVLGYKLVSQGGVNGTVVDAKIVFGTAVKCNASSIILVHNHPSGSLYPSQPDKELTKKLVKGGKLLDVLVLDHIIVTSEGYYSFADEGILD